MSSPNPKIPVHPTLSPLKCFNVFFSLWDLSSIEKNIRDSNKSVQSPSRCTMFQDLYKHMYGWSVCMKYAVFIYIIYKEITHYRKSCGPLCGWQACLSLLRSVTRLTNSIHALFSHRCWRTKRQILGYPITCCCSTVLSRNC